MTEIQYVCLSDMHLGEEDSLLTNLKVGSDGVDPQNPSPVLHGLVECLQDLISRSNDGKKPTLILGGDILELALCTMDQAGMAFETFIKQAFKPGQELFSEIYFIPGNHDHHLWEMARETQYVEHVKRQAPKKKLDVPWHSTWLFQKENPNDVVESYFLNGLLKRLAKSPAYRNLSEIKIYVRYPNLGLIAKTSDRLVVITHGHYVEPLYQGMSLLKNWAFPNLPTPSNFDTIEAENFAWVDFFWSTLGRSGSFGRKIGSIYEGLRSEKKTDEYLGNLSNAIARLFDISILWEGAKVWMVKLVLRSLIKIVIKQERHQKDEALSDKIEKGLRKYMTGPLYKQIIMESGEEYPKNMTFIFGHTHKPFAKNMTDFTDYPHCVNIYNTGGWVVDTVERKHVHGASIVLLDSELNAASIQMYKEENTPGDYRIAVKEARHVGERSNTFYDNVLNLVDPDKDPWKSFSQTIAAEVDKRADLIRNRIEG